MSEVRVTPVDGGITVPAGFRTGAVRAGIKKKGLDLALIVADHPSSAAGVFTTNKATAAPVIVCRDHLERSGGIARAIAVNSGCANACTGEAGMAAARTMAEATASVVDCPLEQVLIASTGVIGLALNVSAVTNGLDQAARELVRDKSRAAAEAIMTTDPWPKETAVKVDTPAGSFHIGGMAKGAGMIEPMMATMLGFLTTDAQVEPARLHRALVEVVDETFNAITVDGERSTNDSVMLLASGSSGVAIDDALHTSFVEGLRTVARTLALGIVRGGEGATKLIAVKVVGAAGVDDAKRAARAIANSLLVKTAIHGGDPNWGRLVAVAGRADVAFSLDRARVSVGPAVLFEHNTVHPEREPAAAEHLRARDVEVEVDLGTGGSAEATVWTCDLSAEYVRINADYRT